MKAMKTLMIIFSLFVSGALRAQVVKAFQQEVIGGTMRMFTDAQGREYKTGGSRDTVYHIYLQAKKLPSLKQLWIDGKRYRFTVSEIATPVTISRAMSIPAKKDTLIAYSAMKTYRIVPRERMQTKNSKAMNSVLLITPRGKLTAVISKLEPHYNQ
jgi:hypothetical protein